MQRLTRPATLGPAAVAAAVSTLACLPRLALWADRPHALSVLAGALFFCTFILWAFVFAWSPVPGPAWIVPRRDRESWILATVGGCLGALLLATCIDPTLRTLTPADYPDTPLAWIAGTLFTLAFVQLFLCFAPFALFVRLLGHPTAAAVATLIFGAFLLGIQIRNNPASLTAGFTLVLLAVRLLSGTLALYLLLRGGPWPLWLAALLMQARLLPAAL